MARRWCSQVQTGMVRDGQVEVISGLEADDEVVSAGQNKLRNDQPININNSIELDRKDVVDSP